MNIATNDNLQEGLTLNSANHKKRNLTIRFILAAIVVTSLLVVALTAVSYLQIRGQAIQADLDASVQTLDSNVSGESLFSMSRLNRADPEVLRLRDNILAIPGIISVTFFTPEQELLWFSGASRHPLTDEEKLAFSQLLNQDMRSMVVDPHSPQINSLERFLGDESQTIPSLVKVTSAEGDLLGVLRIEKMYRFAIIGAQRSAVRVFWFVLIANLLMFFALFYNFLIGLRTIESQEKTLNQQISRLSNLLTINRSMQKSMKTASSRAVEMNEQFLRRVGSDLHDGPAQSLGYAIMRLNRISETEEAKALNAEFHSVREAMDSSLEEIRAISSGLVLPELEEMSLEEALHRVVLKHGQNSDTEVTEYYTDLPEYIPLPVKIMSYRFVQEGLNNAHRHGQAEKCRVTALFKDDALHLSLKDNGMGFRKSQLSTDDGHLGLMGLKDRVESLGGSFTINSELGVGTAIKVTIALNDEALPV